MAIFKSNIKLFEHEGGRYYIIVPRHLVEPMYDYADKGLIAVTVQYKDSTWNTSLLPMGDNSHFIPLLKNIVAKYKIGVGSKVEVSFELRKR